MSLLPSSTSCCDPCGDVTCLPTPFAILIAQYLPWVSVKTFGAVGDGVTDDTDAIQRAVDSLFNGVYYTGTVLFPSGTYLITSPITFKNPSRIEIYGIAIIGQGIGSTTIKAVDCNAFEFENGDNYSVENLFIEQSGTFQTQSGINISKMTHVNLRKVVIYGFENGIYVPGDGGSNNSHSFSMQACEVRNCVNGLKTDPQALNAARIFGNNEFRVCDIGIWISGSSIWIVGNTIEAMTSFGIRLGAGVSYQVKITDNYFEAIGPGDGTGAVVQQGYGPSSVFGFELSRNFYNRDIGGGFGGGKFLVTVATSFITSFGYEENFFYPTDPGNLTDLSLSADYTGDSRSWSAHTIRSFSTFSGIVCETAATDPAARNWFIGSNFSAYGDFAWVQSNAVGGDPFTAGTVRMEVLPSGIVVLHDRVRVQATPTETYAGLDHYTNSVNPAARNWFSGSNVTEFGDFALVQSNAIGGDPQSAGTVRLRVRADGVTEAANVNVTTKTSTKGLVASLVTKTAAYIVTTSDYTILADMGLGSYNVQLPNATLVSGQIFRVKKISSDGNTLTLDTAGGNIDGVASKTTTTQFAGWVVQSDGTNYFTV